MTGPAGPAGPAGPRRLRTGRLDLVAITVDDVAAVQRITADPRHTTYMPDGLLDSLEAARAWIERRVSRWDDGGLGYWCVRLPATGDLIGIGGAERRPGFWNLYYLISHAYWGQGYATELALTAQRTAAELDQALPLAAWIHAGNAASQAVARHLGLADYGLRAPGHWDGEPMHYWADRPPASGAGRADSALADQEAGSSVTTAGPGDKVRRDARQHVDERRRADPAE